MCQVVVLMNGDPRRKCTHQTWDLAGWLKVTAIAIYGFCVINSWARKETYRSHVINFVVHTTVYEALFSLYHLLLWLSVQSTKLDCTVSKGVAWLRKWSTDTKADIQKLKTDHRWYLKRMQQISKNSSTAYTLLCVGMLSIEIRINNTKM